MNMERIRILYKLFRKLNDPKSKPRIGFNMARYRASFLPDISLHNCGTTCCIGGWVVEAFEGSPTKEQLKSDTMYIYRRAKALLDLQDFEATRLFVPTSVNGHNLVNTTPLEVAQCLAHLLTFGEFPDWWDRDELE